MTPQWMQFCLAAVIFLCGCFGLAIRIGYVVSNIVNKITLETDAKVGRMYKRFDEYKDHLEGNFVRRESCNLSHNATAEALRMAADEHRRSYEELKNAILKLNDMVDALLMRKL